MRENRVATVETGNSSEITAIKSQMDTLGRQFSTLMQQLNTQAVVNQVNPITPVIHQPPMNVSSSPVKPMHWQENSKPNTGFKPRACFNCGDPSHIKPQCPLLQPTVSNTYKTPVNEQVQAPQQQA